jgi:hypothetical protein
MPFINNYMQTGRLFFSKLASSWQTIKPQLLTRWEVKNVKDITPNDY